MNTTTSIQLQSSYSDPEFEATYENAEKELMAFDVDAKQGGLLNQPTTQKQYKIRVITPIKALIQKVIDFNYSRNQLFSDMAVAQSLRTTASDKASVLEREKNEKERNLVPLRNEQKSLKESCKRGLSTMLRIIIPALFGTCEGVLVFNMLLGSSLPFIVSFFLALLTALVAGFGLHLGANFICKAKDLQVKRIRYAIVLTISFFVACALGVWRAKSYSDASNISSQIDVNQPAGEPAHFSPWPFILISFISFVVALAFEIKYWLTDKEKRQLKKYEEKTAEVKKEEQAVEMMKLKIEAIRANSNSDSASVIRRQEYACTNEERLLSLAQHTVSRYESTNVEFRKDNQCPEFFGEPVDFRFKLYFTPLFNSIKQKQ
jgi:ABC-type multidrug transport system fused ATPase/permease subunit